MDPKMLHDLKLAVAVAVFVGTALQMIAGRYGPNFLVDNAKPRIPEWVRSVASWLVLLASGSMVILEFLTPI